MHVILSARGCELDDDLRRLIQRRFDRLERYEPRASTAEVTVTAERLRYEIEALVRVDGDERVHGRADADEIRSAVDRLVQKLGRQLRRRHARRRDHKAPALGEMTGPPGETPAHAPGERSEDPAGEELPGEPGRAAP